MRDRALAHEELPEHFDGIEPPDQTFEKGERFRDVVAAVGALPDRQRDAVVLREIEGRTYDEIASELGVSNGSVRQLLNRARNTLRSGATAVTPLGLLARVPWAAPGESMATRVAEICAGGAGAAALTKVCATALVTGAVVGGVASSPSGGLDEGRARDDRGSAAARPAQGAALGARNGPGPVGSGEPAADDGSDRDRGSGSGRGEDRSGPGDGDSRDDFDDSSEGDSSGPGSGESADSQGSGDEVDSPVDNSGPGSLSSGRSGSGSGARGPEPPAQGPPVQDLGQDPAARARAAPGRAPAARDSGQAKGPGGSAAEALVL